MSGQGQQRIAPLEKNTNMAVDFQLSDDFSYGCAPFHALSTKNSSAVIIRSRVKSEHDSCPRSLTIGSHSLRAFGLVDDWQTPDEWMDPIDSIVLEMQDVIVHSSAGIIVTAAGEVVADTLAHTRPERDNYRVLQDQRISLCRPNGKLSGRWIHALLGNDHNYFHYLLMNIGRLALLDLEILKDTDGILVPAPRAPFHESVIRALRDSTWSLRYGLKQFSFREVGVDECLQVEKLVVPWNVASEHGVSKVVVPFLREVGKLGPLVRGRAGRRIYIDRRSSENRPILNETALVEALEVLGITPVKIEDLSFLQQVALFSQCELIVAPHGAGLSNLVFAPHGARVVEIVPHTLRNWCYRAISETCDLVYDCVLSRSLSSSDLGPTWAPTIVAVDHVLSAVELALSRRL
jgi:hypothetical protein